MKNIDHRGEKWKESPWGAAEEESLPLERHPTCLVYRLPWSLSPNWRKHKRLHTSTLDHVDAHLSALHKPPHLLGQSPRHSEPPLSRHGRVRRPSTGTNKGLSHCLTSCLTGVPGSGAITSSGRPLRPEEGQRAQRWGLSRLLRLAFWQEVDLLDRFTQTDVKTSKPIVRDCVGPVSEQRNKSTVIRG